MKTASYEPGIFEPEDVSAMAHAVVRAIEMHRTVDFEVDPLTMAREVLRLHRSGLKEPEKLAALAALCVTSGLFRQKQLIPREFLLDPRLHPEAE